MMWTNAEALYVVQAVEEQSSIQDFTKWEGDVYFYLLSLS